MTHSISSANGVNPAALRLSEEEPTIQIERKYRVIEPILKPSAFGTIWQKNAGRKVKVIDRLAILHRLRRRTIYNWLAAWQQGGEGALARKSRRDKGNPRLLTEETRRFLVAAIYSEDGARRGFSVRSIYRLYCAKIVALELTPTPAASYSTVRAWVNIILQNRRHTPAPAQLCLIWISRRGDG